MRNWILGAAAACVLAVASGNLRAAETSEGLPEIIKLAEAGVGEEVLLAYIDNSAVAYNPSVEEIIMLHDLGLSAKVISGMIEHGRLLRLQAAKAPETTVVPPPAAPQPDPLPPPQAEPLPQPAAEARPADPTPAYEYQQPERERVVERIIEREPAATTVVYGSPASTVVYAPPADDMNVSFFYESLSPYGSWVLLPDYGYVWQPTVVRVDPYWRPYFNGGRWVWTNHGWYWQSTYSWGWAPFHYGRWTYHPVHRWVWCPDTVWGPAWVHWRRSEQHCGWAPLPPHSHYRTGIGFSFRGKNVSIDFNFGLGERDYCFVPVRHFRSRDLAPVALPRQQVTNVYNNTTIINNTYVYNDNRIINNGVPVETVAQASNAKIEPLQVAEARVQPGDPIVAEQQKQNQLVVFKPQVKDSTPDTPDQAIARRKAFQSKWQAEQTKLAPVVQERQKELAAQGVATDEAKRQAEREARRKVFEEVRKSRPVQTAAQPPATGETTKTNETQDTTQGAEATKPPAGREGGPGRRPVDLSKLTPEERARREAEFEARRKAELEAANAGKTGETAAPKTEGEAREKTEAETAARKRFEEERAKREAKRKAETEEAARKQNDAEAQKRAAEELARKQADAEARKATELEAKRKNDAEAHKRNEEERAKREAEREARRKAEAEEAARKQTEAEAQKRAAEQEARRQAEAQKRAEELARKQAEAEAQKRAAEQEARRQAEAQKHAEELARKQAEAEAQKRAAEQEARRRAEAEAQQRAAEAQARKQAEAEAQQRALQEQARRQAELEAQKRAAEEAARRQAEVQKIQEQRGEQKTKEGSDRR